ncbi:MAG TPA: homoserine O-succinyltransferase [Hyphomicrobiales bacterium]|nr:homoserine O-succinyltransferase [Hyphomicrobiales bacterium]
MSFMLVERRDPERTDARPPVRERRVAEPGPRSACLDIGLLNNMPDAALQAAERQFMSLLAIAAGSRPVRLHFYSLAAIPRGPEAEAHIARLYADIAGLPARDLDGLFVTGSEPRAPKLDAEPYWPALTRVIEWAADHTGSTVWSCLAAHAAVLHFDGIERQPLPQKCFGVFESVRAGADLILAGAPERPRIPHSRHNGLDAAELVARGYRVVTRAAGAGVDIFTRQEKSRFVFFQGHPEYDATSLAREYRRDVGRYLRGERDALPPLPAGYFPPETEAAMAAFAAHAARHRDPALLAAFPDDAPAPEASWRTTAVPLFRNWLAGIAIAKAGTR